MSKEAVFHRLSDSHVVTERLADGSLAIFDSHHGTVHSLHPSAAAVWDCCVAPVTIPRILQILQDDGGVSVSADTVASALRELERAGLVQREEPEGSLFQSRRAALRQIAQASAATALPLVLTLTAAEQRVYAQGNGSPLLNLNGEWSGTSGDEDSPITWTATQSGNSVTGPFVVDLGGGETVSGTLSGTISGTVFTFTITVPAGGVSGDPGCAITGSGTSPATTDHSINGSYTLTSSGCVDPINESQSLSMTKS
jgi:hypothetical protein